LVDRWLDTKRQVKVQNSLMQAAAEVQNSLMQAAADVM
jgi:hypothetical protein